jgi:Leucine-rich repeat (LRR) protein
MGLLGNLTRLDLNGNQIKDDQNLFIVFKRFFPNGGFDFDETLNVTEIPKPLKLRVRPLVNTNEASVSIR